jgi:hypothetical protein
MPVALGKKFRARLGREVPFQKETIMSYLNPGDTVSQEQAFQLDGYIETISAVREAILAPMSARDIAELLETAVGNEPDKLNDLYREIVRLPSFKASPVGH